MAKKTGLSQTAIVRIWHAFGLQPHRVENFKFSKDPQFVEKVRDCGAGEFSAVFLCKFRQVRRSPPEHGSSGTVSLAANAMTGGQ